MPPKFRKAHQALDRAMDWLYRRTAFASERERIEHLFMRYEEIRAPFRQLPAPGSAFAVLQVRGREANYECASRASCRAGECT